MIIGNYPSQLFDHGEYDFEELENYKNKFRKKLKSLFTKSKKPPTYDIFEVLVDTKQYWLLWVPPRITKEKSMTYGKLYEMLREAWVQEKSLAAKDFKWRDAKHSSPELLGVESYGVKFILKLAFMKPSERKEYKELLAFHHDITKNTANWHKDLGIDKK